MAANLQMRGFFTGVVRGVNKIICGNLRDPTSSQPYIVQNSLIQGSFRRFVHSSLYEKNEDDGAHLNRVPEDVIEPQTQKSWVPHPKTGVFGPAEENNWTGGDQHHSHEKSGDSVLEQQAWFRPLEDVQKQPYN
ncbi:hypothetical protein SUGI_0451280 [Cryptomeria japonica]|uniref:late embryogenesis abundant protein At5g17165 n=1 Tax=Cryptomeria japonica TaxID=3369 RepID=UPI0024089CFE|nr:late embryogenesis abundant protein At5g17165 [Cryptomeria japonica]GLJ23783.1 hypothetical protein SUGI_0451280 [Cryptomeria japonica]